MGSLGWPELVGLSLVVFVLFGADRIPEIFRGLGQGVAEIRKAVRGQ